LKPSSSVALHRHSNALVDILPPEADSSIAMLGADEKPDVKYSDVGGLDAQKQEIREAVELPLSQVSCHARLGVCTDIGLDGFVQEDWYRSAPRGTAVRSTR
jgi:26S proteasome regulatory subunit T3